MNNHNQQFEEIEEKILQKEVKKKKKVRISGKKVFELQRIIRNKSQISKRKHQTNSNE